MELLGAGQILPDMLVKTDYDLFLLSAGYEERSTFLVRKFNPQAKLKIAFAFKEKSNDTERLRNNSYLIENNFRLIEISGDKSPDFNPIIQEIQKNNKEKLNILVDYSSMTKTWLSAIINYLIDHPELSDYVDVHFAYSPAVYSAPSKTGSVKINTRISYPDKKSVDPGKPVALLIGLGLDSLRAEYIVKKIQPEKIVLLYADPANDIKYVEHVFQNNTSLIEHTDIRNLVSFPLGDMDYTDDIITDLCLSLRTRYNVIIAPLGPKVLTLLALLLSTKFPDINVLRISSGANAPVFNRLAANEVLVYSTRFVSDELEY